MLFENNQVSLCPVEEIKKGIKEIKDKHNVKIMSMFVNPENLVEWVLTCTLPAPEILGIKRIDPNGEYWSWYENERDTFLFVFNYPMAIELCFPYGTNPEIEKGRGKVCRVSVKEIRKLDPKLDSKFSVTRDEKKDANKT